MRRALLVAIVAPISTTAMPLPRCQHHYRRPKNLVLAGVVTAHGARLVAAAAGAAAAAAAAAAAGAAAAVAAAAAAAAAKVVTEAKAVAQAATTAATPS